jgi:hypothetical protein
MSVVAPAEGPKEDETTVIAVTQVSTGATDSLRSERTQAEVPAPTEPCEVTLAHARLDAKTDCAQSGAETESSLEATETAVEPVTMAVAAMSETNAQASRWTAVSLPLTTEDAGLSLEHEMQQAYAAFAAAEHGHLAAASMTGSSVSSAETTVAAPSVPAAPAPEEAQSLSAVASAATEAVTAAVKELENVASAYAAQASVDLSASQAPPVPLEQCSTEAPQLNPAAPAPQEEPRVAALEPAQTGNFDASGHYERPEPSISLEEISHHSAAEQQTATAAAALESTAQITSELSAPQGSRGEAEAVSPRDTAAMAATVGGKPVDETSPESDTDPAIASIVDSVLANLRPKIVEEISRKLGRR